MKRVWILLFIGLSIGCSDGAGIRPSGNQPAAPPPSTGINCKTSKLTTGGTVATYLYDGLGRLARIDYTFTSASYFVTAVAIFEYDAFSRISRIIYSDSDVSTFEYPSSNITIETRNGLRMQYEYLGGRLQKRFLPDDPTSPPIRYEYGTNSPIRTIRGTGPNEYVYEEFTVDNRNNPLRGIPITMTVTLTANASSPYLMKFQLSYAPERFSFGSNVIRYKRFLGPNALELDVSYAYTYNTQGNPLKLGTDGFFEYACQ